MRALVLMAALTLSTAAFANDHMDKAAHAADQAGQAATAAAAATTETAKTEVAKLDKKGAMALCKKEGKKGKDLKSCIDSKLKM